MPMDTLIDLAKEAVDEATRDLGRLQIEYSQGERQLDLLHGYRQDYLNRLQESMRAGMAAADCHNYQRFITTLDEAIAQQTQIMQTLTSNLARGRLHWQQQQRKLSAFETLAERRENTARIAQNRREQRNSDEYAARMVRHRHSPF
jgi:flagellar FliJ protein